MKLLALLSSVALVTSLPTTVISEPRAPEDASRTTATSRWCSYGVCITKRAAVESIGCTKPWFITKREPAEASAAIGCTWKWCITNDTLLKPLRTLDAKLWCITKRDAESTAAVAMMGE